MVSLNLFNSSLNALQDQAKVRKRALFAVLITWSLLMTALISSAAFLDHRQQNKLEDLQDQASAIQAQLVLAQAKHRAFLLNQAALCLVEGLESVFAQPIQGLHLSSLSYAQQWQLEGWTDRPQALVQYKYWIEQQFESSEWKERLEERRYQFTMEGFTVC